MAWLRKRKLRLLLALYIVCIAGFVLHGCFCFAYERLQGETRLPLASATMEELELVTEGEHAGSYQSLGGDPRMVFDNLDTGIRRVVLVGRFNQEPGEMDLYYTKKEGQGFSPKKRVWARPIPGGYEYLLPPGRYHSLRLDAGASEQNLLTAGELLLNPPQPLWRALLPTLRQALGLLVFPALASCVFCFIIEVLQVRRQSGTPTAPQKGNQPDA